MAVHPSDGKETTSTWKFVAKGNDAACTMAIGGNVEQALREIDKVRDQALEMEQVPSFRNEIECRRLETRLYVANTARDVKLFAQVLREMGQSNRFTKERLHENVDLAGACLEKLAKDAAP